MSAALETLIARSLSTVEEKTWAPDREVTLGELRIVDMIHEGKPTCRLCGQIVNQTDQFGLCSKTTDAHKVARGVVVPARKAGRR
ncbi:hypothetical protein [Microbacterium aurantiacum]|uniref:hypothetical protein n=1 Tax=Microbacterium aurantiacum TaxID=162393 RepID=UPI000C804E50|nr:hypothetical protein [Microbacterium aurantiacum]